MPEGDTKQCHKFRSLKGQKEIMGKFGVVLLSLSIGLCAGCGGSRGVGVSGAGGSGTGKLYVSNTVANAILHFNSALTATGNVSPGATIKGAATTLSLPQAVLVIPAVDRLFVANQGNASILIFDNASTQSGNVAPTHTISGSVTNLTTPFDLSFDNSRNLLYVANGGSILVFGNASTISGSTPPLHTMTPGFTIGAIFVDGANDRLYVADSGNAIDIFDGASNLDGTVVANRIISGANTALSNPAGLQLDSSGRLLVSNLGTPAVTIFANAATASGNIAPVATVAGSNTGLKNPLRMTLNPATNDLYLADGGVGGVDIFANIVAAKGSVNSAPGRSIAGASTGLASTGAITATGIALDPTR